MINFSKKAASRFKFKWPELPERTGDYWKLEIITLGRTPMLLMVHEYTLFTLVRRKSEFKNIQDVAAEIWQCCSWHKHVGEVSIGKNTNRKLNGSLTGMKRITEGWYTPDQINSMEMQINSFLFSYLSPSKKGYGKPFEAVEKYMTGLYPQK